MKIFTLPNGITCLNLLCGCFAIYSAFKAIFFSDGFAAENTFIDMACIFIIAGAVFDFFDGMTARLLKISSPIGKELDSLADIVTFGIAPAVLCYSLMRKNGFSGILDAETSEWLALSAFVMAAFSALRLAKFNLDERQTTSFIGMPTPANALFWIGMTYIDQIPFMHWALNGWILAALMLGCSFLLISELPMFSLKIKFNRLGWKENALPYSLVLCCIPIFIIFKLSGAAIAILLYILLSLLATKKTVVSPR